MSRIDDLDRLRAIADLGLHDHRHRSLLQQIVDDTATELGLPMAAVSIVMGEAQYFAAHHGLGGWIAETEGTPVEWAFCKNAVESDAVFEVRDAETHPKVKDNPLVHNDGVRCYLGVPLVTSGGHTVGTLCVIGTDQHAFSDADRAYLHEKAAEVVRRIEAARG